MAQEETRRDAFLTPQKSAAGGKGQKEVRHTALQESVMEINTLASLMKNISEQAGTLTDTNEVIICPGPSCSV